MAASARGLQKDHTLPISFFEENRVGNLPRVFRRTSLSCRDAAVQSIAFFVRQLVLPIVCIPLLFAVSFKLSLVILIYCLSVVSAVDFGRFIRNIRARRRIIWLNRYHSGGNISISCYGEGFYKRVTKHAVME